MKDDKLYLIHISECIERIESYVGQMDAKDFADSTMVQDAVKSISPLAQAGSKNNSLSWL